MVIKIWFQKSFLIYKNSRVHTTAITAIPNIIIVTVMVLSMDRPSEDGAHLPWEVSGRAGMKNIMSGMLWLAKSCDNLWRISPSITLSEGEVEFLETQTVVRSSEDCVECWKGFWWVNSEDERASWLTRCEHYKCQQPVTLTQAHCTRLHLRQILNDLSTEKNPYIR